MYILKGEKSIPEGFRKLKDEEIASDFLKLDLDKSYMISKNEWIATFVKILINDMEALDKEAPDAIMGKIKELSDEFDKYDVDHNKYIDYLEYKNYLAENILICD